MAALRRLTHLLCSKTATFTPRGQRSSSTARKVLKVVAAGACVTAAAGAAYYGSSSGLKSRVEARLRHLALPSVSASDKVKWTSVRLTTLTSHTVTQKTPAAGQHAPVYVDTDQKLHFPTQLADVK